MGKGVSQGGGGRVRITGLASPQRKLICKVNFHFWSLKQDSCISLITPHKPSYPPAGEVSGYAPVHCYTNPFAILRNR